MLRAGWWISDVVLCGGAKLGLFGFVFSGGAERNIRISPCSTRGCSGFGFSEIGFVLRNNIVILW